MKTINTHLERDPRYTAAKARYTELQIELDALDRKRDAVQSGIGSLSNYRDQIGDEAELLLSGGNAAAILKRDDLIKNLEDCTHRIAVLREAVSRQKSIVAALTAEIGKSIAIDLLPQHRANVAAMVQAIIQLNAAAAAESDLRESLYQNGVPYSSCITPMIFPGFGLLRDPNSRASGFLLECVERGFLSVSELPGNLKPWGRAKLQKPVAPALAVADADGWAS